MTQPDKQKRPSRTTLDVLAENVQRLRERRGLSAAELARAVTDHGVAMTRDTVTNIENRRRDHVRLDEVYAVAFALKTSPVSLILPTNQGETVAIGNQRVPGAFLELWWSGRTGPLELVDEDDMRFFREAAPPIVDAELAAMVVAREAFFGLDRITRGLALGAKVLEATRTGEHLGSAPTKADRNRAAEALELISQGEIRDPMHGIERLVGELQSVADPERYPRKKGD